MNPKSRVALLKEASSLDYSVTAVPALLSKLELPFDFEMDLPLNLKIRASSRKNCWRTT
jgi:hypothetical protein